MLRFWEGENALYTRVIGLPRRKDGIFPTMVGEWGQFFMCIMSEHPFHLSEYAGKNMHNSEDCVVAVAADGRKSSVRIIKGEDGLIGHGEYGTVRRVQAEVVFPRMIPTREREQFRLVGNMAVKEYDQSSVSEENIRHVFRIHDLLRSLGISTWNTFRHIEGQNALLMTDGERDGAMTVAYNASESRDSLFERPFLSLENFEEAVGTALDDIAIANTNGIYLHGDSWFVNLRELAGCEEGSERTGTIEKLFIGDFDRVRTGLEGNPDLVKGNVKQFVEFVDDILLSVCLGKDKSSYVQALSDIVSEHFPGLENSRDEKTGVWRVEPRTSEPAI